MKVRVSILAYLSLFLTLFASCTANNEELYDVIKQENSIAYVSLNVNVSDIQESRTLTETQENTISNYVLFIYENSTLKYVYKQGDNGISLVNGRLTITLPETNNAVDFHLFTNVDLSKVKTVEAYGSTTITDISKEFEYLCSGQIVNEVIPMYGKTTLDSGITAGVTGNISLVRSMAKITVNVNDNNFVPKSIKVVNVNDGVSVYYTSDTEAYLPASPTKEDKTVEFLNGSASVYIGETNNTADIGETNNTADSRISVILYGFFKGTETWYRFDMITKEAVTLETLLRNHHYIFEVGGINHLGSGSESDALRKKIADNQMVTSDVKLFDITNDAILSITSDDAAYVGVSAEFLTLKGDAPVGLTVLTNNTIGTPWVIDSSECVDAFDFSGETAAADKVQTIWIWKKNATAGNNYTFYIVAGNIRKPIVVTVEN